MSAASGSAADGAATGDADNAEAGGGGGAAGVSDGIGIGVMGDVRAAAAREVDRVEWGAFWDMGIDLAIFL